MSPLFLRIFALVGMALAIASLQMKARAGIPGLPALQTVQAEVPAPQALALPVLSAGAHGRAAS